MMARILEIDEIAPAFKRYLIHEPVIARRHRAGQFVMVLIHDHAERIPLTIADSDAVRGTITLVVQEVGKTTMEMGESAPGDSITVVGPLGKPTHIENWGTCVCVGGGAGIAPLLPIARALLHEPEVLFLDEAVSALDPAGRKEVLELIEHLRGQCTVFMSTHILADVERVCDTIGIISRGRLVTQAPREALLAQYAIPAFEVETESGFEAQLNGWAEVLRQKSWVQSISISGLKGRVIVHEIETAKRELLHSAIQAGLVLTRYEMLRPSLEEVFLRLVGEGRKT